MPIVFATLSFLVVTFIVVSGYLAATAESPITERLRSVGGPVPGARPARREPSLLANGARRLLTEVGKLGFGGDQDSLTSMLAVAGIRTPNAAFFFLGVRTLLSVAPAVVILVRQVTAGVQMHIAVIEAIAAWGVGHSLCNFLLRRRARNRAHTIEVNLPDTLDLMVVCLEAGLGLNATIARVGEERSAMDDPLGAEFGTVSRELREGRSREDALRGLSDRNGVDDLKSLTALIVQSDRLGASMAKTLRAHAEVLRTKRRQRAEEQARKLPIKMLFPLGFFLLPSLLVIVIGPAMIKMSSFFGLMTQHP